MAAQGRLMMILFIGPNGSGKSDAAERLALELRDACGALVYVATMTPADEDARRRIAAHRRGRSGLGFVTVESPRAEHLDFVGPDDVVLLEDVSNLLANLTFSAPAVAGPVPMASSRATVGLAAVSHSNRPLAITEAAALARIEDLRDRCRHLIAVTIGGLAPQPGFDPGTAAYIAALNRLNTVLARQADRVITMPEGGEG